MASEVIKVKVTKDGQLEVMAEGIVGKSCVEATADLEVYLGKQVEEREYTADYFKKEPPKKENWITRR
jgi:hypothetical protein